MKYLKMTLSWTVILQNKNRPKNKITKIHLQYQMNYRMTQCLKVYLGRNHYKLSKKLMNMNKIMIYEF